MGLGAGLFSCDIGDVRSSCLNKRWKERQESSGLGVVKLRERELLGVVLALDEGVLVPLLDAGEALLWPRHDGGAVEAYESDLGPVEYTDLGCGREAGVRDELGVGKLLKLISFGKDGVEVEALGSALKRLSRGEDFLDRRR